MPKPMILERGSDWIGALAALILARGLCDERTIERARRVAAETGRLDLVLIQLGLVTERDLAEAYAALLGTPLAYAGPLPGRAAAAASA